MTMLGKHHNEKTKAKMSIARRGENNPMFGKKGSIRMLLKYHIITIMKSLVSGFKYLGAGIVALSGAPFGFALWARYEWNQPCLATILWVVFAIFLLLGLSLSVLGMILGWREEHKRLG